MFKTARLAAHPFSDGYESTNFDCSHAYDSSDSMADMRALPLEEPSKAKMSLFVLEERITMALPYPDSKMYSLSARALLAQQLAISMESFHTLDDERLRKLHLSLAR